VPTLLVVHHTPSPPTHALLDSVRSGAGAEGLESVEVVLRPALALTVPDVLAADGFLLGTPANFGYMSGALKHALDTVYYPCLDATAGRPWGLWVHGNDDVDGAVRSVQRIVTGLGWRQVAAPVTVVGAPTAEDRAACAELAATVAANLLG
jgi:multimeric flavodoxin WrbA